MVECVSVVSGPAFISEAGADVTVEDCVLAGEGLSLEGFWEAVAGLEAEVRGPGAARLLSERDVFMKGL